MMYFYYDALPDVRGTAQCYFSVWISYVEATKQVTYDVVPRTTRPCTVGPFVGIRQSSQGVLVR